MKHPVGTRVSLDRPNLQHEDGTWGRVADPDFEDTVNLANEAPLSEAEVMTLVEWSSGTRRWEYDEDIHKERDLSARRSSRSSRSRRAPR